MNCQLMRDEHTSIDYAYVNKALTIFYFYIFFFFAIIFGNEQNVMCTFKWTISKWNVFFLVSHHFVCDSICIWMNFCFFFFFFYAAFTISSSSSEFIIPTNFFLNSDLLDDVIKVMKILYNKLTIINNRLAKWYH